MGNEIITISMDKEVITKLRTLALAQQIKKGFLGKFINEAVKQRLKEKEQNEIAERQIQRMEKGYHMGKNLIKHRDELHDRRL